jgi:hypothetical protein
MTCCLDCTHWYYLDLLGHNDWGKEPGICTLYPKHQECLSGHWCGQFAPKRDWGPYDEERSAISSCKYRDELVQERKELRKEVRRLKEVAKGLRRKLKEERSK